MRLMEWHSLDKKRPDFDRKVLVMYEVENNDQTTIVTSTAITHNAEEYYKKFIEEDMANGNEDDLEVDRYLLSQIQNGTDDPLRFTILNCDGDEMPDDILPDEVLLWAYAFEDVAGAGAHIFDALTFKRRFAWCIIRLGMCGFEANIKKFENMYELPFNDLLIQFEFSYDALIDICNVVPLRGGWCMPAPNSIYANTDQAIIICSINNNNDLEKAVIDLGIWINGLEEHFHNCCYYV